MAKIDIEQCFKAGGSKKCCLNSKVYNFSIFLGVTRCVLYCTHIISHYVT